MLQLTQFGHATDTTDIFHSTAYHSERIRTAKIKS